MTALDDRLSQAVTDLRRDVETLETPPFVSRRSTAPALIAFVLLLGVGVLLASYSTRVGGDPTDDRLEVVVATQPDQVGASESRLTESEPAPELVQASVRTGQLTSAAAGEFMMPIPAGVAWSPDETRVILYRTGSARPGHLVVDVVTGETIGADPLPFTPADIEQVYWHPNTSDVLLYTSGSSVMAYDLVADQSEVLASFDECDKVDSGVLPVPPAGSGLFSLLCHAGEGRELLVYDLGTGESMTAATTGDTAAVPSATGGSLVRWNDDGTASVLDDSLVATGVTLDLDNNVFALVVDSDGREWAASTLFDGPAVGTIVMLPLDGTSDPVVVIGPDRGDPYPPSGTSISAGGGVVAVSIPGVDDGELVGRITAVDLGTVAGSNAGFSTAHNTTEAHGYWSRPFLSVSPSGQFIAYSSDSGSDRVNTFIAALTNNS